MRVNPTRKLLPANACLAVGLIVVASLFSHLSWANGFGAEMESQGQVEQLHFGEQQLQISGRTYDVGPGLQVEIDGTYGAFTLLQSGMKVYLRFVQHADGRREVLEIRELAPGDLLEES